VFLAGVLALLPTANAIDVQKERTWIAALSGLPRDKVASTLKIGDLIGRADAGLALQPGDLLEDLDRRLGVVLEHGAEMTIAEIVALLLSQPNAKPP
jgi:hypothetical protein